MVYQHERNFGTGKNVVNGNIKLHLNHPSIRYKHWIENVKDWCISRQLWWGHRYRYGIMHKVNFVVAKTPEEANGCIFAQRIIHGKYPSGSWCSIPGASSWLWPISVFNGLQDPEGDIKYYYYPTNTLVTAPEILFSCGAHDHCGICLQNDKPFSDVYLTGIVR